MSLIDTLTAADGASRTRRIALVLVYAAVALLLSGWYLLEGRWLMAIAVTGAATAVYLAFRLPPSRYLLFAGAAIALSTLGTLAAVGILDVYLHHRYEDRGGFNVWGYRGSIAPAKAPGEYRIVVLGGSTAFGYGVGVHETIPAYLERDLPGAMSPSPPVRVINLAWNGQGAHSFPFVLDAYDYLDYDAAVLYSGYNDLLYNPDSFRERSAIFRLTGYLPILPVVPVREWLHVGDLSDTQDQRVVFQHTLKERYAAEAADTALRISQELERQIGRLTPGRAADSESSVGECGGHWGYYCEQVASAVDIVLARGKTVFVVTQPYISDLHVVQQSVVAGMLRRRFPDHPRVHYIDLGRSLSLDDRELCYDGMHLTPAGNAIVARALAARIAEAGR